MLFDLNTFTPSTFRYVTAVAKAIRSGALPMFELTRVCTECQLTQTPDDNSNHVVVSTRDADWDVAVVIGCEGYWLVNPALVGIDSPGWQPAAHRIPLTSAEEVELR